MTKKLHPIEKALRAKVKPAPATAISQYEYLTADDSRHPDHPDYVEPEPVRQNRLRIEAATTPVEAYCPVCCDPHPNHCQPR